MPTDRERTCEAIRAELVRQCPTAEIVFGPDADKLALPVVRRLRERGAHFDWVAMSVGDVSFWELHVGIVLDAEHDTARTGVHRSASSGIARTLFERLERERPQLELAIVEAPAAEEIQFVHDAHALASANAISALCREARELLVWAAENLRENA